MAPITVRPTAPEELRIASDTMRVALLSGPVTDDEWAKLGDSWAQPTHDSLTAWEGAHCVGHAGGFRFDTVVPGGARLATCGVTRVGVLPTHTRRGILTQLMGELLDRARAEGRPLASLRASEGVIYGRFGFGVAADSTVIEVETRRARPIAKPAAGSYRLVGRDEFFTVVPSIYERAATRPGVITRDEVIWRRYFEDFLGGEKAEHVVVHTGVDGVDDGFAHYSVKWTEEAASHPAAVGEIHDLWGTTPEVELALWAFLVDLDLVTTFTVDERALDDIVRMGVADPRAVVTRFRYDEQWVRLLDVDRCLSSRTYGADAGVVIAVEDPWYPDNTGSWRVAGDGVVRTDATADITTDIAGLSAAYLGSTPWWELVAVGRASASAHDATRRADALFAHRPLAFCGSHF